MGLTTVTGDSHAKPSKYLPGRVVIVAAMLCSILTAVVASAPAASAAVTSAGVTQNHQGSRISENFKHWNHTYFEVDVQNGPISAVKVQVQAFRSTDDPNVDAPYFSYVEDFSSLFTYYSTVEVPAPPSSFQSGLDYVWRARWWADGDGGNPTGWSSFEPFSIDIATGRPGAPYPLTPTGAVAPDDNILRVEQSLPEQTLLTDPIVEYMVEIKLSNSSDVYWETTVPAPASATAPVEVQVPDLPADTKFKWRAYARTASATDRDSQGSSSASRWRYFQTTGPQFQATFDYIPHRAGSYLAGDTGDEISGAVASRQYPGIYWMIRDNGPGDRARLYAVKIDPATGQLANIDGYGTKEFDVIGGTNLDWEAISIDSSGRLYIFDSGSYWDGDFQPRTEGLIYRVAEPNPYTATSTTVQKTYPYTFPNGENFRNVEAVFNVGDVFFLIAKEDPHRVYSLPRWLSENGNSLWGLGSLSDEIGNISGAEFASDLSRFAITTTPDRAYFWDLTDQNFTPPNNSSTQSRAIVQAIIDNPPTSHYYYRKTDTWAADGIYDNQTAGITDPLRLLRGMQTEGIAFAENGNHEAMMVSEYGRHTLFVPSTGDYNYYERPGINSTNVDGTIPGTADKLIPAGSWWWYDDDGTPSADWNQPGASRASMTAGTALFGYPDRAGSEVQTELAPPSTTHVTDYFVQDFTVADTDAIWGLEFNMTYDDAAVMYINGVEVWRDNLPSGPVEPDTLALQWRNDNLVFQTEVVQLEADFVRSLLVDGTNTVAVEVHQNRVDSSDSFFDLELRASAPRPVTGIEAEIDSNGTTVTVDLDWDHDTPTPVAYQIWERPMATGGPDAGLVLVDTVTTTDATIQFDQGTAKLSEYFVVPVGGAGGNNVVPGMVIESVDVANVSSTHVSQADPVFQGQLPAAGTAVAIVNDYTASPDIGDVIDLEGWTMPVAGGAAFAPTAPVGALILAKLTGTVSRVVSAVCAVACGPAASAAGIALVVAVVGCLLACPLPDMYIAAHQIDASRTIPPVDLTDPEDVAILRALELQLSLDAELRDLADQLGGNDGPDKDPDFRWNPNQIAGWISAATVVCTALQARVQAEYLGQAAVQGADVVTSAAAYVEGTVTSGADGLLRVTVDGQTTLMQACRPFPIYTPGAFRKPVSAADVDGKPWQNGDAGWFMQATSSHIRTAILEPENNFVTVPIDQTEERREIFVDPAEGGRTELAPVLLRYRPKAENPLPREWYIDQIENPDWHVQCNFSGVTCDEYPFFSTQESSVWASLMLVPSSENSPQGSDLRQFQGAANGCDITGEYAAGQPAAFLVIPMSKFGLGISQNFPGVPLPSAYVCPDRTSE